MMPAAPLIFDLRDPLHPKIVTSFTDMADYMHPHSGHAEDQSGLKAD